MCDVYIVYEIWEKVFDSLLCSSLRETQIQMWIHEENTIPLKNQILAMF